MEMEILPRFAAEKHSSYVYRVLRYNIVNLILEPGTIVNEQELADSLHVSRTPVREAIFQLKEDRLMESYPQSGSKVSMIDVEYFESIAFMRNAVETKVMRMLCQEHPTSAMMEKLQNNLEMQRIICESTCPDHSVFLRLDREFHDLLCEAAGFSMLSEIIGKHLVYFDRLSSLLLRFGEANPRASYEWHRKWFDVVVRGDINAVEGVVNGHLSSPHAFSDLPDAERYFTNLSREGHYLFNCLKTQKASRGSKRTSSRK